MSRYLLKIVAYSSNLMLKTLGVIEKSFLGMIKKGLPFYIPTFIIGAPRTGSTILYQVITNSLEVGYIDNLMNRFYRSMCFGFLLSSKLYGGKSHNCFSSYHGNTFQYGGWHAPSECGAFWYRWLPRDDHFVLSGEVDLKSKLEIRNNIHYMLRKGNMPFVFKNLNAGQRMDLLYDVVPEAKYLFVKRDPLFTAQSIYNAKKKVGMTPEEWWSIKPKNWRELEKLDYAEQIVKQIYFIEKQIHFDVMRLGLQEKTMTIQYEDFVRNIPETLERIRVFMSPETKYRAGAQSPEIVFSEKRSVPEDVYERLCQEVAKYDWETYRSH